jgi:hypothetical protein
MYLNCNMLVSYSSSMCWCIYTCSDLWEECEWDLGACSKQWEGLLLVKDDSQLAVSCKWTRWCELSATTHIIPTIIGSSGQTCFNHFQISWISSLNILSNVINSRNIEVPLYVHVILPTYHHFDKSRDVAVGIVTGYGLDNQGVRVQVTVRARIFSSPSYPDRFWSPPSLLSNGYQQLFPQG